MSLFRSIFQHSTERRPYSRAYELPLYREPTNIPRSLTESVFSTSPISQAVNDLHASTVRLDEANIRPSELVELQRREQYLQQRLQALLDAQADGLLAGFGGGLEGGSNGEVVEHDNLRSGSSTPTASSMLYEGRASSVRDYSSTREQKIGLSTARKRIYQTIRQLSAVKLEEDDFLSATQADNERVLEQIDAWQRKRTGLQREMQDIESRKCGQNFGSLQAEADKLSKAIQDMEIRLAQMKARHGQILEELAGVEDAVQSKLSSYQSSLTMLEADIKAFLKNAPERAADHGGARSSSFLLLPPKRRTLSMAKEYWQDKMNDVEKARKEGEVEKDALDQGSEVWKGVVNAVTHFEGVLKEEVALLARETDRSKLERRTQDLLEKMDGTLREIEAKFKLAEENDWTLLICCIGAELEAFKQGTEILESLLNPQEEANPLGAEAGPSKQPESPQRRSSAARMNRISSPPENLMANDSDDDPDPELLISHQRDTDDE